MRTILFAVAVLIFTASAHAAAAAPNAAGRAKPIHEEHTVVSERDAMTGTIIYEIWYKDGRLDRADGPAVVYRNPTTGIVTLEAWYKNNKRNRADGPARIVRDAATGALLHEAWWKDGKQIAPPSGAAE
jgi:hypothetical protein